MSSDIRMKRLAGTIRKHLSAELARDLADPRLAALAIQDVELTPDLGLATVTVRHIVGGTEEAERAAVMNLLTRLGPRMRSTLAPQLRMRRVPQLRFRYDVGTDHLRRIEAVLQEIREEDAQRPTDEEPDSERE